MLDFTKLWDKRYLLGPNPVELSRSDIIFFWLAVGFVLIAVAAKGFAIKQEPRSPTQYLLNRFFHLFLTSGILVLLWSGARFENIPWLSTHIVVLFLFLIWAIWLGFIVRYFVRNFKIQQRTWEEEQLKQKYLRK